MTTQVDQNREDDGQLGRISQDTATPTAGTNQADALFSDSEAADMARKLTAWARHRWGVKLETKYICPLDDSSADYEGYCPDDGRKLKRTAVECDSQDWRTYLEYFIDLPDYPEAPLEVTT